MRGGERWNGGQIIKREVLKKSSLKKSTISTKGGGRGRVYTTTIGCSLKSSSEMIAVFAFSLNRQYCEGFCNL